MQRCTAWSRQASLVRQAKHLAPKRRIGNTYFVRFGSSTEGHCTPNAFSWKRKGSSKVCGMMSTHTPVRPATSSGNHGNRRP